MTPTTPPTTPPNLSSSSLGQAAARRRRAWVLVGAAGAVLGLGALLGHGLGQSLAQALPSDLSAALPALLGAAVAALLAPLGGWLALRITLPALADTAAPARRAATTVTHLRAAPPVAATAAVAAVAEASAAAAHAAKTATAAAPPRAAVSAEQAQSSARDALTGAYSQQHFVAATDREWSRIRRHGEDAALLMIDVDHFKRLNTERGMPAGDAMLVEITRLASSTLRPYDLLARFGGGVLVVYLPHTDPLGALDVAERIRERVFAMRLPWQGQPLRATISVGVAGISGGHGGLDAVIADAGAALREAKIAGRNCVRSAPMPPRQNHKPARSTR